MRKHLPFAAVLRTTVSNYLLIPLDRPTREVYKVFTFAHRGCAMEYSFLA